MDRPSYRQILSFAVAIALAVASSPGRSEDQDCDAGTVPQVSPGAEALGEAASRAVAEAGGQDGAAQPPAQPASPRERRYTIYGYNDRTETVVISDPDVLDFLDGSGIAALRADEIALGPGGGALAAFTRAYGERFNAFQRARANRRNERLWKSQYFGSQDEAGTLATRVAGRATYEGAISELLDIRPTTNLVIVDPRSTDVPAGMLVSCDLCVRADGTLDSAYPPLRTDFCPGGRRISVMGVYTHVFDPDHRDWTRRLEMRPIRVMARITEADGTRRVVTAATFAELTRAVAPQSAPAR